MSPTPETSTNRSLGTWLRELPRWKLILLGTAVLATVAGGVLTLVGSGAPAAPTSGSGGVPSGAGSLLPGQNPSTTPTATAETEPGSRGLFRLGFSFLAGFCLGTFLRATLKFAAIAIGFWLAMTFLLAYFGLVVVDWNAIDGLWNRFATNVEQEWGNFQSFITGSLPAAGLAGLGLFTALKRR